MGRALGQVSGQGILAAAFGQVLPCQRCRRPLPELYIVHPGPGRRLPEQLCPACIGALWAWVLEEEAAAVATPTE